ncbi:NUDIX hydrolase [Streptomyces sp. NPDC001985]|uniref:NUDIX hydrolase n=1 Tax=Streptomyces sp. NPDC001985 TaxID=3154406 RepID=UPI0033266A57
MPVADSDIVKALTGYMHQHPTETGALMPLYEAMRDHSALGVCPHDAQCPLVKAAALVVDEEERVLAFSHRTWWAVAEGAPQDGDQSLGEAALRVLGEYAGIRGVWAVPGAEDPVDVDVIWAAPEEGRRLRFGFRYLFRADSRALPRGLVESGQARWVPMSGIAPRLAARLRSRLVMPL